MDKILFNQTVAFDLHLKSQYNKDIKKKLINYLNHTYYSNIFDKLMLKRFISTLVLLVFLLIIISFSNNKIFVNLTSVISLCVLFPLFLISSAFIAKMSHTFILKISSMIFGINKDYIYLEMSWDIIRLFNFDRHSFFENNNIPDHLNKYLKFFIFEIIVVFVIFIGLIFSMKNLWHYIFSANYFNRYDLIFILLFLIVLIFFTITYFFILTSFFTKNGSFKTIIEILRVMDFDKRLLPKKNRTIILTSTLVIFYFSIILLVQTTNIYYALIELFLIIIVPLLTIYISNKIYSKDLYKIKTFEFFSLISIAILNYLNLIDNLLYLNKATLNIFIFFILLLLMFSLVIETIKVENSWKNIIDSLNKIKKNRNESFIDDRKTIECYNIAIDYSNGPIFLSEHKYIQQLLNEINLKEVLINLRNYNQLTYQKELIKSIQFDDLCSGILDENVSKIHYFKIQLYEKLEKQNIEIIQLKHYKTLLKEILNNPEKLIMYFLLLIIPLYIIIVIKESGLTGLIEAVKTLFKSYFFP